MAFTSPRYSCQIPKLAEGPPVLVRFVDPLPSPGFMRTAMAHPHHEVQLLLRPAVGTLRPNPLLRTWKFTSIPLQLPFGAASLHDRLKVSSRARSESFRPVR